MTKVTQKEIRRYVSMGIAECINSHGCADYEELSRAERGFEKIAYSSGVYGLNGLVLQGCTSGKMYAITSRCTALFIYG